jgi:hypothetical protein
MVALAIFPLAFALAPHLAAIEGKEPSPANGQPGRSVASM